jgi:enoyl-CoA hydratase/carnithine racemase
MIPGVAGTQTLPRLTGLSTALALTLSGEAIDAPRARELGLVQQVVAPAALRDRTRRLACRLAQIPAELRRPLKRLVSSSLDYPLAAGLAIERRLAMAAG